MSSVKALEDYISDHPEILLIAGVVVLIVIGLIWWIYRPVTWQEGNGPVAYRPGDPDGLNRTWSFLNWLFRR